MNSFFHLINTKKLSFNFWWWLLQQNLPTAEKLFCLIQGGLQPPDSWARMPMIIFLALISVSDCTAWWLNRHKGMRTCPRLLCSNIQTCNLVFASSCPTMPLNSVNNASNNAEYIYHRFTEYNKWISQKYNKKHRLCTDGMKIHTLVWVWTLCAPIVPSSNAVFKAVHKNIDIFI